MNWKDVGQKIAGFAPLLGSVVSDYVPYGTIPGGIISAIARALGAADETPNDIADALDGMQTDEARIKLIEIQTTHEAELQRISLEQLRVQLADVQNARNREVKGTEATGKRDVNLYVLAWVMVAGFFVVIGLLMVIGLPETGDNAVMLLFGSLAASVGQIVNYFFGSSRSSAEKTVLMAKGATP